MGKSSRGQPGDWRRPALFGAGVILFTFGVLGGWANLARLDSAIVASGTVVVESDRKVVQHLEGGIVAAIHVAEAAHVKEGDVLVRIDPTQAQATLEMNRNQLLAALAEEARLDAEMRFTPGIDFPAELRDAPKGAAAMSDQQRQFEERGSARLNEVAILRERIAQAEQQISGLRSQDAAVRDQIASYTDEVERLRPLGHSGLVPLSRIRALDRSKSELEGRSAALGSEVSRLERQVGETNLQIQQVTRKTVEEVSGKLAETRARVADLREKVRMAEDVLNRADVRAPRSGKVVNVKVHTVGAVVRPGDTLLEIVPEDEGLIVAAKVAPLDVAHVYPGLPAEVRLPSFKSRTTPIAIGTVSSVSADVVRDELSRQPYYDLRVSVKPTSFPESIRKQLVAGMPAEVIVSTGERTVIAYLTQPLADAMRRGMREH